MSYSTPRRLDGLLRSLARVSAHPFLVRSPPKHPPLLRSDNTLRPIATVAINQSPNGGGSSARSRLLPSSQRHWFPAPGIPAPEGSSPSPPWMSQASVRLLLPGPMSPSLASPTIPSGALVAASQTPTPPPRYIAWPQRAHAGETSIRTSISSQAPTGLERPTSPSTLLPCLSKPNSPASAAIIQTPE